MATDLGRSLRDGLSPFGSSQQAVSPVPASIPSAAFKVEQHYSGGGEHYDYAFSPEGGLLRLHSHHSEHGTWWAGDFVDYRGVVSIQMEDNYLRLDAVEGNRCHVRTWRRGFGDRTVAKLARAFLSDLHGAPEGDRP